MINTVVVTNNIIYPYIDVIYLSFSLCYCLCVRFLNCLCSCGFRFKVCLDFIIGSFKFSIHLILILLSFGIKNLIGKCSCMVISSTSQSIANISCCYFLLFCHNYDALMFTVAPVLYTAPLLYCLYS